ncbi:competence type IV pilus minor pilin ComGF [Halalkalibacter sp. APA_J-10(15)]|uniref:competence type IV pilus minor pilin ComGF n=1 Tax=Halalkalibacter sp. APA_J-10(15) TaxID=2933805 RepID=UPI001FF20123|nr:competence type IV pilus minor pilin ComGF [Halalkalibacter sp. APA_J-10(15)]MCK0472589.1 prepilin-type N-terminal cleavage/methylation domain-containing protein [Halalkalibacter sp. APA_J-10(15)]
MNIASLLRTNKGFTLFEMLIVLMILLVIASMIPLIITTVIEQMKPGNVKEQEVTVFFQYLDRDVRETISVDYSHDHLVLTKGNKDVIRYQMWNENRVRRNVNGLGHVLMLEDVFMFRCDEMKAMVHCAVVLENGRTYEKSMIPMLKVLE